MNPQVYLLVFNTNFLKIISKYQSILLASDYGRIGNSNIYL